MKSKYFCPELFALILLAVILSGFTALERQQQRISENLIRLHVVANSDTVEDQEIKLQVRDAVLTVAEPLTASASSAQEANELLAANLGMLQIAANETLIDLGVDDRASVTLKRELFDVRHYDTFSLPGGYYDSLCVTIGNGEGKNWWCVVYPGICAAATTEDQRTLAVMAGISEEEYAILSQDADEYVFKFKILELFEEFMGIIRPMIEPS